MLDDIGFVITQNIFNDEGISFVSFTYRSTWSGDLDELTLQTEEISEAAWFTPQDAFNRSFTLRPRGASKFVVIRHPAPTVRHQEHRPSHRHANRRPDKRSATASTLDVGRNGTEQIDGVVPFAGDGVFIAAIMSLPPPSLEPSTAKVGLEASNVSSLSIVVMDLRSPSISITTTRTPSTWVDASPPRCSETNDFRFKLLNQFALFFPFLEEGSAAFGKSSPCTTLSRLRHERARLVNEHS